MPHYLTLHNEPTVSREAVEANWIRLSHEQRAIWVKTWFNLPEGRRFCWWDAPDETTLARVFDDYAITWDEMIEVELTTPSDWRWRED